MIPFYELLVFILATYGLSWIVTQSHLFKGFRDNLWKLHYDCKENSIPAFLTEKLAYLFQCIVCTGTWVGIGLGLITPYSFLRELFPPIITLVDIIFIIGLSASSTWMLSTKFDSDTEEL